jgi:ferredoxin
MLKVSLDPERCAGHGRCYALAPSVYEADEEGFGLVVIAEPTGEMAEAARLGANNCPERAIDIDE